MNRARTRELALALTGAPSVTDSDGEGAFPFFLCDLIAEWPYFRSHPDQLRLERTVDDQRERYVLIAKVDAGPLDGEGQVVGTRLEDAVILTGHYDVVSAAPYGKLECHAFDPEALAPLLMAELEASALSALARGGSLGLTEERALRDLESGDFLPGRGLLDMKAGLAAGLVVLEGFAAKAMSHPGADGGTKRGAMIFLAVPDEEGSSHGMLSAVRILPPLLAQWRLRALVAINLDASVDQGGGETGRAIFLGSVGKLHPFVLFVGRPTHAGAAFDGVNPALLAAEYTRKIECSLGLFCNEGQRTATGEIPPPPTVLYSRDLRDHYDVTTPGAVFVSVNLLVHDRGPTEALAAVSRLAMEAMDNAIGLLRERAHDYSLASGGSFSLGDRSPRVLQWAELERMAKDSGKEAYAAAKAAALAAPDRMEALAVLAAEAVVMAGIEGPAAIVGLAPPYYPRSALDPLRDKALIETLEHEAALEGSEGRAGIALRPYFPGISDMSFLNPSDSPQARQEAAAACPLGLDALPSGFSCPAVNIGPWGREYHQRLERLHAAYAFETLPHILDRITSAILAGRGR